ncbi:MAG TPA: sigma-70 family RNA polymerase sigma factor [Bacteroidetes bacterium]|nr:sigma-70 family RNA polymerase sigma factor [Bacteroidota bacterium]
MNEAALIAGCLKGSLRHQRELYDRYSGRMMGICMRYAGSEEEAEDILQEGFVIVFRKIDTYRGTGELGAWIRRVFVNAALMNYRRNKKHRLQTDFSDVAYMQEASDNVLQEMSAADLMQMVQSLPLGSRMVFNLYAIEGFNHREIGEKLGISPGTSKSQFSRARKLLRKMIENEAKKVSGPTIW